MTSNDLEKNIGLKYNELLDLRIQNKSNELTDNSKIGKCKKEIARLKTQLNQNRNEK